MHIEAGPAVAHPVHLVASPSVTEGPFFVDEKLNRSDLVNAGGGETRPSVASGLPLALAFQVYKLEKDAAGADKVTPFEGACIDVWHADAKGVYSDESGGMNHEDTGGQTWLRGYQITDAGGRAQFRTIVPGWYASRTPHIHFKVRRFNEEHKTIAEFTSQLFFHEDDLQRILAKSPYSDTRTGGGAHGGPGGRGPRGRSANQAGRDTMNADDDIYSEPTADGSPAGSHLLLDLKNDGAGHAAEFCVVLTDESMRPGRRGGRPPGGPPGRGRGPGGPPPRGRGRPPGPPPDQEE
jgi:protocatechuate 3,4-dioxygenase beta subunit